MRREQTEDKRRRKDSVRYHGRLQHCRSSMASKFRASAGRRQRNHRSGTRANRAALCEGSHIATLWTVFAGMRRAASIARFTKQEGRAGFVSAPMGLGGVPHDLEEA